MSSVQQVDETITRLEDLLSQVRQQDNFRTYLSDHSDEILRHFIWIVRLKLRQLIGLPKFEHGELDSCQETLRELQEWLIEQALPVAHRSRYRPLKVSSEFDFLYWRWPSTLVWELINANRITSIEASPIILVVENFTRRRHALRVKPSTTVLEIKHLIADVAGPDAGHQRLVCRGKKLEDYCTVEDYNLRTEEWLFVLLPFRTETHFQDQVLPNWLLAEPTRSQRSKQMSAMEEDDFRWSQMGLLDQCRWLSPTITP